MRKTKRKKNQTVINDKELIKKQQKNKRKIKIWKVKKSKKKLTENNNKDQTMNKR